MADTPIAVTRALPSLATPNTTSLIDIGLNVTKADFQPDGKSVLGALAMSLTATSVGMDGSLVNLNWQQGNNIQVGSIGIEPQTYNVVGNATVSRDAGSVTLSGSDITLTIGVAASPFINVDSTALSFSPQDLILEENHYFVRAAPTLSPQSIGLVWAANIISASPTFSASDVTLTLGASPLFGFDQALPTFAPQDIGLQVIFSLTAATTGFEIAGSEVPLDYHITDGIAIERTPLSIDGSSIVLTQTIPVTAGTNISFVGNSIGFKYDWGLAVDSIGPALLDPFGPVGQDIGLSFTYTLGLVPEPSEITFAGSNVVMFMGNGQPRRHRVKHKSPGIEIMLKPPITTSRQSKANVR